MKKLFKYLILGTFGGTLYYLIEIFYRGYSHWTMFCLAFVSFILVGLLNEIFTWEMSLFLQSLIGGITITLFELATGYIINIKLGWNVWEYQLPFSFFNNQINLFFSCIWCLLSLLIIILDDYIRYWLFNEEKPHYHLFGKCKE